MWSFFIENIKKETIKMTIQQLEKNGTHIAWIPEKELLITDVQSALDLAATVKYETGCTSIILDKASVCGDFFILSTGLAGEILQKFTNYGIRAAFVGDYSGYTSKPLHDFIYESNHGRSFFFVPTKEEAVEKLCQ